MKKPTSKYLQVVLFVLFCGWFLTPNAAAAPQVNSRYYCLMEGKTGQVLMGKNQDEKRPVASTTKIMTALVALEYAGLDEIATVSRNAQLTPEYAFDLREGQTLTIEELIKVALMRSANDAAVVLAEHITGDERFFAHLMSKKAWVLGAYNTHFENASGLPSANSYSTAYDMALISRFAISHDFIAQTVSTIQSSFKHPSYNQPLTITNSNRLLSSLQGADGIKTGTTNAAGRCLAASATREQRQLIAVCLKSGNRFGDGARLLEYGFSGYMPVKVIDRQVLFKTVKIFGGENLNIDLYPARTLYLWYDGEQPDIEKKVILDYAIKLPVQKDESLGMVSVYANGRYIDSIALVSGQTVKRGFWPQWLNRLIKGKTDLLAE
ncbi:MAG: D-alanyl-D-alanine carboxypeptidase [Syntrophomonadaceae bacterium]|nr:D-alanyl-D-alanine carboxypeptidase [Syntrophomonadaceae bacterium]